MTQDLFGRKCTNKRVIKRVKKGVPLSPQAKNRTLGSRLVGPKTLEYDNVCKDAVID